MGQAAQIQQQLEQIGQSLKGAGVTYENAESANVSALVARHQRASRKG
jgi:hypothetical protein